MRSRDGSYEQWVKRRRFMLIKREREREGFTVDVEVEEGPVGVLQNQQINIIFNWFGSFKSNRVKSSQVESVEAFCWVRIAR